MNNKIQISACTISSYQCKCFEKLSEDEMNYLNENSVTIHYKKKEIICKQGSFVSHVMFVEKGLVKVYIDNGHNSLVLKMIPEGNLLGLSSVSETLNTYQYSAMAYIDTHVKQIDVNIFRELLTKNAEFSKEVIDIFSTNSAQVYGRFFCLTHKQAYGRLADILLCLSERIFKQSEFQLPLSRKDLAELSGMSAETVIRMLKKFNEEGLIKMDGKSLEIINYERLQRISETG
ncbi:MAG: Crp/Fnr family transcriptional regulator [Bacteroidales bacterium]|nr:Crp/Fnr family transcriptional regulator [Bacteroidales bacterium]